MPAHQPLDRHLYRVWEILLNINHVWTTLGSSRASWVSYFDGFCWPEAVSVRERQSLKNTEGAEREDTSLGMMEHGELAERWKTALMWTKWQTERTLPATRLLLWCKIKPNKKFCSEVDERLFKDGLPSPSIWSDQVQATKQRKYNKENCS